MKRIYRTDKAQEPTQMPPAYKFTVVDNAAGAMALSLSLLRAKGLIEALKAIVKISTPDRAYYAVTKAGRIVSDGWILFGRTPWYPIGPLDHIIGPINTVADEQGKGLASAALMRAVKYSIGRGAQYVYIDTDETNIASQKTILKSGLTFYKAIE